MDPGFYDWGATDYSEDQGENAAARPAYPGPGYTGEQGYPDGGDVPYPQQQENAQPSNAPVPAQRQEYHFAAQPSTAARTEPPLKVIFKGSRTAVTMQNYMVNATSLTDLDADHFEKIPLDQVDVAATQEANRSHGIDFQIPIASRD